MGYVRKRRQFKLVFEGEEFEGLEVRAQSTSMGKILEFVDLSSMNSEQLAKEQDSIRQLFAIFMENVTEWNLEHEEGVPTPRTFEGLMMHDPEFVLQLAFSWMDGVLAINGPLGRKSSDGKQSEEPPIPMEIL